MQAVTNKSLVLNACLYILQAINNYYHIIIKFENMDCRNQSYEMNEEHYDQVEISTNPYFGSGKQQTKLPSTVTNTEPNNLFVITVVVLFLLLTLSLVAVVVHGSLADYSTLRTVNLHGDCIEETRNCTMYQSPTTNYPRYCATSPLSMDCSVSTMHVHSI